MKSKYFILVIALFIATSTGIYAQKSGVKNQTGLKTDVVKVWGNCSLCKSRIEGAIQIDGVTKADWNKDTKLLTVTYVPGKISLEAIQKKIAAAGHDTEKYRADDAVYAKLPTCCQYKRDK